MVLRIVLFLVLLVVKTMDLQEFCILFARTFRQVVSFSPTGFLVLCFLYLFFQFLLVAALLVLLLFSTVSVSASASRIRKGIVFSSDGFL